MSTKVIVCYNDINKTLFTILETILKAAILITFLRHLVRGKFIIIIFSRRNLRDQIFL